MLSWPGAGRFRAAFAFVAAGLLALIFGPSRANAAEQLGFRVPEGFEVSLYADDNLAHDIFSLTIDAKGRVVVAGPGYVKILQDTNNDGRADAAILYSTRPKSGAHGMYFDGNDLVCSGDNSVLRFTDANGDGVADGEPQVWLANVKDSEHAANGIIRGPEGWYYLICGNDAGVGSSHVRLPGSPVSNVNCGAVVRITPDGKGSDVFAHGFRNPYDLDFNAYGQLFTVDADGERDHHLPWYAPNRVFDIAQGMHHGWILKGWVHAWSRPESNFDNVERLSEIGRGSPTGVLVYRHRKFPAQFQNGLFSICWTFGRIYFFPLERSGATYKKTGPQIFMETTGATGFAPTDMAVDPKGDLYVAIGGRGTRGGVFRVTYKGELRPSPAGNDRLRQVLTADQPLSSWSRARWVPQAKELGKKAFEGAAVDKSLPVLERIRALEILVELFGGITPEIARMVSVANDPEVTARAIWALSWSIDGTPTRQFLASMTYQKDPRVQRAAWEAIAALPTELQKVDPEPNWLEAFGSTERRVRSAAMLAGGGPGRASLDEVTEAAKPLRQSRPRLGYIGAYGPFRPEQKGWWSVYLVEAAESYLRATNGSTRLDAIRAMQIGLGDVRLTQDKPDVFDGYSASWIGILQPTTRNYMLDMVTPFFPYTETNRTTQAEINEINRESVRLLAMLSANDPYILARMAALWSDESSVEDDIHYLIASTKFPVRRPVQFTAASAAALVHLHYKMNAGHLESSRYWPVRVGEAFQRLLELDPALAPALVGHPQFGLPDHCLFAKLLTVPEQRADATHKLLARAEAAEKRGAPAWTPELIELIGELPPVECLPVLRRQWNNSAVRDVVALTLAKYGEADDRARLLEALQSVQPDVVEKSAGALARLQITPQPAEFKAAVLALKRYATVPNQRAAREALAALLQKWSGQNLPVKDGATPATAYNAWFEWFTKTYPAQAAELAGKGEIDMATWQQRFAKINWNTGDATRGRKVFEERTCHRCHEGAYKLGPDLAGIGGRFSLDDLFIAIVDPNRDVSPTYSNTVITTRDGNSYSGVLVYDSPSARLLQTAPDTTVRILGPDIVSEKTGRVSLMPAGLLDGLPDQSLADLYAYLKAPRNK